MDYPEWQEAARKAFSEQSERDQEEERKRQNLQYLRFSRILSTALSRAGIESAPQLGEWKKDDYFFWIRFQTNAYDSQYQLFVAKDSKDDPVSILLFEPAYDNAEDWINDKEYDPRFAAKVGEALIYASGEDPGTSTSIRQQPTPKAKDPAAEAVGRIQMNVSTAELEVVSLLASIAHQLERLADIQNCRT